MTPRSRAKTYKHERNKWQDNEGWLRRKRSQ